MTDQPSQPPEPQQPQPGQQPPPPPPGYEQQYQQPGYYQQAPQAAGGYTTEMSPADQRMWAMLAHLGGILFYFLAPLIVWLVQKDRGAYVADQSKEALNFQLTMLIGSVIGSILIVVGIGIVIVVAIWIMIIVFSILAALAANKGEAYRYPVTIRMVK